MPVNRGNEARVYGEKSSHCISQLSLGNPDRPNYPGGIGFSEPLFDMHVELLDRVHRLIADCACEVGCPACVGPVGLTGPHVKAVALEILEALRRLS